MGKNRLFVGSGVAALGAAMAVGTSDAAPSWSPPVESEHVIVVSPEGDAAVADAGALAEGEFSAVMSHQAWAARLALGGMIAGIVGLIGFNGLMNFIVGSGRAAAKAAETVVKAPVKAAASVARATARAARKPVRYVAGATALGAFLIAGIALLDIQWKAGLVIGAGTSLAGAVGWARVRRPKKAPRNETPEAAAA